MLRLPIFALVRRMMSVLARVSMLRIVGLCNGYCVGASCGPFNQFVKLTPVKPNAPALWAVVNFNALTFGHQEIGVRAGGAFHMV